jgi:hypothetical protein
MKISIRRFRVSGDGYDSPLDDDEEEEDDDDREEEEGVREVFDIEWTSNLGGLEGKFAVRGLSLFTGNDDGGDEEGEEESWKERFLRAEEELRALRSRVLDAVT